MNENTATTNANNANVVTLSTPARGVAPKHDDNQFASKVALDGLAEVELARLAVQKAKNPEVKRFAQRMVNDHSQASAQLKQLVSNIGMTIPAEITDEQKTDRDRLAKLTGDEFDLEYMQMMVTGHDRAVAAFEEESREGSVPDVKSWATKMLPTLKEHQALAKEIAAKLG